MVTCLNIQMKGRIVRFCLVKGVEYDRLVRVKIFEVLDGSEADVMREEFRILWTWAESVLLRFFQSVSP